MNPMSMLCRSEISPFVQTGNGMTLTNNHFKFDSEQYVNGEVEYRAILKKHFDNIYFLSSSATKKHFVYFCISVKRQ